MRRSSAYDQAGISQQIHMVWSMRRSDVPGGYHCKRSKHTEQAQRQHRHHFGLDAKPQEAAASRRVWTLGSTLLPGRPAPAILRLAIFHELIQHDGPCHKTRMTHQGHLDERGSTWKDAPAFLQILVSENGGRRSESYDQHHKFHGMIMIVDPRVFPSSRYIFAHPTTFVIRFIFTKLSSTKRISTL